MRTAFVVARFEGLETVFMVGQWTEDEAARLKPLAGGDVVNRLDIPVLAACGWGHPDRAASEYALVVDLQSRKDQGAIFRLRGLPEYDLHKRGLRVSCLWERFLAWLYTIREESATELRPCWLMDVLDGQPLVDLELLPPEAEAHLSEASRKRGVTV